MPYLLKKHFQQSPHNSSRAGAERELIMQISSLCLTMYVCMYVCMLSCFRKVIMYSTHAHTMAMHWPASSTAPFLNVHTKAQATVLAC